MTTQEELQQLIVLEENENLEFKEAKNSFPFEKLLTYCVALANEGGGKIIFGITDKKPRTIVGSSAFMDTNSIKLALIQKLQLRIEIEVKEYSGKRIVVFTVPSRPIGIPIQCNGTFWMRGGESLIPMTTDTLKMILDEKEEDFSSKICKDLTLDILDPKAIDIFRSLWIQKSHNDSLNNLDNKQLLFDADLINAKGITYAALILLGTKKALRDFLPQSEIIFEYRSSFEPGAAQQRIESTIGFFLIFDELWKTINLRNDLQHYQDAFFVGDVSTFNEKVIRESILNAVAHRDYQSNRSIFVIQYPQKIEIISPGGFPKNVTPNNIIWNQYPRNRRIAETFVKCGIVERAGQGMNMIYRESIREGKLVPNFTHSEQHQVYLTLDGKVYDSNFLRFFKRMDNKLLSSLAIEDFLILDFIRKQEKIPKELFNNIERLLDMNIIEKYGRGRGVYYELNSSFYPQKKKHVDTKIIRKNTKDENCQLLLKIIKQDTNKGSSYKELAEKLPSLTKDQIKKYLQELKAKGVVYKSGSTRKALWHSL